MHVCNFVEIMISPNAVLTLCKLQFRSTQESKTGQMCPVKNEKSKKAYITVSKLPFAAHERMTTGFVKPTAKPAVNDRMTPTAGYITEGAYVLKL